MRNYGIGTPENLSARMLTEDEWAAIEKCQPFVFHSIPKQLKYHDPDLNDFSLRKEDLLAAPFECFSLEAIGRPIVSIYGVGDPENSRLWADVLCVLSIEKSPGEFNLYAYAEFLDRTIDHIDKRAVFLEHSYTKGIASGIGASLIHELNKQIMGIEHVRQNIRISSGKNKRSTRLRRLIHVSTKKLISSESANQNHSIDWSHRFLVRGHWRKIDGLGKNRNGDYCVSGHTWVIDHAKGSEHLPLVDKKVRLLNESVSESSQASNRP
jgi:hypothetical protein